MINLPLLVGVLAVIGYSNAVDKDGEVLIFTAQNFDNEIVKHETILVEFYAPWCGHCKALKSEYEGAALQLKDDEIPLAKVDCDAEKTLCEKYEVKGYPTLKIFRNGAFSKAYEGPRQTDGIVKYMRGQAGPSSVELKTDKEAEKVFSKGDYVVMGCFAKDSNLKETYLKVAAAERENYRFCHTTEKVLVEKYKCKEDIIVFQPKKLHSKFEEQRAKYTGSADAAKIKEFLKKTVVGLCGLREMSNMDKFGKPLVVVYYNIDYEKDAKGTNYYRNRVMKVAQDYKNKVYFAVSNKDTFSHEIEEFGLADKKSSDKPIVAARGEKGEKYPMQTEFSVDNLKTFVDDMLAGRIENFLKSEPIPEKNDEPVKIAVAKNFDELVNDETKDVLIEFYAPWCGHCKQLAPIYEELAKKLKDEHSVRIVKMDATANDVPKNYEVSGFPTIFWVPKNNKNKPEPFTGGREVKDFLKFIAEKSTDELVGFTRDGKKRKDAKKEEL